jgi:high affinity Mn2+ porin
MHMLDPRKTLAALLCALASCLPIAAGADTDAQPWDPQLLAAQANVIHQRLLPFAAKYSGPLSLTDQGDNATSETMGAYFGIAVTDRWQAYLDIERLLGGGVGGASGLGSPTNGDVVHAGNGLPKDAYIARAYVQYLLPLGAGLTHQERAQDQLPGHVPTTAFLFKLGKLSVGDDFDQNRYANSVRTQFESWTLINDGAFDYPADTRGYTGGFVLGYLEPAWSLKFGYYRMPQHANQEALEWPLRLAHGAALELDLMPNTQGTVLRLLAYRNVGRMGIYQEAIDIGQTQHTTPDIVADDAEGRVKHGIGINVEQPLADDGETGLFARLGWNDGRTESFNYTEVDQHLSLGAQLSGVHWAREDDRLGLAMVVSGLSSEHRQYLALGGHGFVLGDGALNYGRERLLETYYRIQLGRYVQLSPDVQYFKNPGYNRDRGAVTVYGLRLHLQY